MLPTSAPLLSFHDVSSWLTEVFVKPALEEGWGVLLRPGAPDYIKPTTLTASVPAGFVVCAVKTHLIYNEQTEHSLLGTSTLGGKTPEPARGKHQLINPSARPAHVSDLTSGI